MENHLKAFVKEDGTKGSPKLLSGLKNFIIDIDGVVCEDIPNEEPERMKTAQEIKGSKEQVNKWHQEGHIITFFTVRSEDCRAITENWLHTHGFKYHEIILGKPRGGNYHYIDDKNIRATQFTGKMGEFVYKKVDIQVFE
ncbi:MAG: phosphoheptose isomerase [Nanoarchaeota archaeon]